MSLWHDISESDCRKSHDGEVETIQESYAVKVTHNSWHYRDNQQHESCTKHQRRCDRKTIGPEKKNVITLIAKASKTLSELTSFSIIYYAARLGKPASITTLIEFADMAKIWPFVMQSYQLLLKLWENLKYAKTCLCNADGGEYSFKRGSRICWYSAWFFLSILRIYIIHSAHIQPELSKNSKCLCERPQFSDALDQCAKSYENSWNFFTLWSVEELCYTASGMRSKSWKAINVENIQAVPVC